MAGITKKDYTKIKYRFHELKAGESIFDIGDLKPLRVVFEAQGDMEKAVGLDPEFVMKYIILMNSPGSPAIERFQLHGGKRKTWVLSQLGVEPNASNKYEDKINYLTLNKIPEVVRKISVFRSLQKPTDFAIALQAEEELHYLLAPVDPDEGKSDLTMRDAVARRKLIDETRIQLEEALGRLATAIADRNEQQDVAEFVAQTFLGIRQEETLLVLPAPKKPHEQRANAFFPEVGN